MPLRGRVRASSAIMPLHHYVLAALFSYITVPAHAQPPPLDSLNGEWIDTRVCAPAWDAPREVCAGPGTTAQACAELGCCWSDANVSLPWCFLPNAPTNWEAPEDAAFYASLQAIPSLFSRLGGARAANSGDIVAVTCGVLPPYVQECDYNYGEREPALGFPAAFAVNGARPLALPRFQWTPVGVRRAASDVSGTQVTSEARLLHSEPVLLVSVSVGSVPLGSNATVSAQVPLLWRDFSTNLPWGWSHPQQRSNASEVRHTLDAKRGLIIGADTLSPAVTAASVWSSTGAAPTLTLVPTGAGGVVGAVSWTWTVTSQTPATFGFIAYIGRDAANVSSSAAALGGDAFPATWARAEAEWEHLWEAAFTPDNAVFSGSLPVLPPVGIVTPAMSSVYYMSVLSTLLLFKSPPLLPEGSATPYALPRGYVPSAGAICADTAVYLWDTGYAAPLLFLLEPDGTTALLDALLRIGIHSHYALDTLSFQGVGPWYAFNSLSVYNLLTAAAAAAERAGGADGEAAFWLREIGGQRAIDWLDGEATFWTRLPPIPSSAPPSSLAAPQLSDYGLASNLLECVPSYLHGVPSLQAANVLMLNVTARVWEALGNVSRAAELTGAAEKLLPRVLSLFDASGEGFWDCAYPNGSRVGVRHVIDFFTIAESIGPHLPPEVVVAMEGFLTRSLLTTSWMRALALDDPAAPASDRADHGPYGAYDGWPAKTADGLLALGRVDAAIAMFDRVLPVLREGPFGQSHRVYDNPLLPELTTAKGTTDQQYAASVSAGFAVTALRITGVL